MEIRTVFARVSSATVAVALLLSIGACNKDSTSASVAPVAPGSAGPGGQPTIAQVPGGPYPNAGECLGRAAPQSGWWSQYGFQPYGSPIQGYGQPQFNPFPQGYICGCPTSYMPTCSPQGLMCAPMHSMNYNVVTWHWNSGGFHRQYRVVNPYTRWYRPRPGLRDQWTRATFDFDKTAQTFNGTCSINSVAQLCSLAPGAVQPTYPGMYCMPLNPGSPYGVWIRQ